MPKYQMTVEATNALGLAQRHQIGRFKLKVWVEMKRDAVMYLHARFASTYGTSRVQP